MFIKIVQPDADHRRVHPAVHGRVFNVARVPMMGELLTVGRQFYTVTGVETNLDRNEILVAIGAGQAL